MLLSSFSAVHGKPMGPFALLTGLLFRGLRIMGGEKRMVITK